MTLPFDESEIAFSQKWDGRLTWNEKDVSHPFMTMILTTVTANVPSGRVGSADEPDSDRGDGVPWTYLIDDEFHEIWFMIAHIELWFRKPFHIAIRQYQHFKQYKTICICIYTLQEYSANSC